MRQKMVRLLLVLALAAGTMAVPNVVKAQDNAAVAINNRDGAEIFRLAFHIRRTMQDEVDIDNAAAAVSSCTDCQTVALAIQVVLILSDPSVVTTDNVAIA